MQDERPDASAYVTVAAGVRTLVRSRNVADVYRAGNGIYHVIWPLDKARRASEYDFKVTAQGATFVESQFGDSGSTAAPGGANAAPNSLSLQLLFFDAAGVAVEPAGFHFTAERA